MFLQPMGEFISACFARSYIQDNFYLFRNAGMNLVAIQHESGSASGKPSVEFRVFL